jgi:hypothetical protein
VDKFVAVGIQPSAYAVTPTPVSTIVILPTVRLSGVVGLNGNKPLIWGMSNVIRESKKLDSYETLDAV